MKTNTLSLIKQLIDRTKNEELIWIPFSKSNFELKPIYQSPLDKTPAALATSVAGRPILSNSESYACKYNNGYFFLLVYQTIMGNSKIELRVQTQDSKNSKVYASSTGSSTDISSQLKRLYNLIDNAPSLVEIDNFIDNFMENE